MLPGLELYLWAYHVLDGERNSNGLTAGSIPRRAVREYAEEYGLDEEQLEALYAHVRTMDAAKAKNDQREREQRIAENPQPRRLKKR